MTTAVKTFKDRSLAAGALIFLIAFCWQMQEILGQHSTWTDFQTPAGVGDIARALVFALIAVAASLGLDVSNLIRGFTFPKEP